ncbi:hypothetical protein XBFM1_1910040 [Xenorhabdus bovienii str. feltiae Moldova]|uniref:Uncharacterized protein n=1 Tax=Xenorhabdus bovienii str. feltiae Moldova TaxID=1398200 RepID=A0A077NQR7_XENBV|nr:hypothetical protein XBFM1_1910040 [Xenorhabdus bovienii str. feltiae Moldova]
MIIICLTKKYQKTLKKLLKSDKLECIQIKFLFIQRYLAIMIFFMSL